MIRTSLLWPGTAALVCVATIATWLTWSARVPAEPRMPTEAEKPKLRTEAQTVPRNRGTRVPGSGQPADSTASWPQFRGTDRTNIVHTPRRLKRSWPSDGLKVLWSVAMGEGYAGAVVHKGRVYVIDYDQDKHEDAIRCLSLDTGAEIWRYTYYVKVKRNHGMSRTVPAVTDDYVVTIGPKCHVNCLSARTGERVWAKDMVEEFGAEVPPWYAGQCPRIDGDRVILAPGGDPLMLAADLATGKVLWHTPNPGGWGMTHSSIAAIDFDGERQYVYCTTNGVAGVSGKDGRLLWTKPDWYIKQANSPTPLVIDSDRILFTGSYRSGSCLIQLDRAGDRIETKELWRIKEEVFACEQQTPIYYQRHIFGVTLPKGHLVCMDLDGRRVWSSGGTNRFERGPYLLVNDLLLVLHGEEGTLHLVHAGMSGFTELAKAEVLTGHEAWAPMAWADGRLIVRDLKQMVCLELPMEQP